MNLGVVQLLSQMTLFVTPWTAAPGFFVLHYLLGYEQGNPIQLIRGSGLRGVLL